MLRLWSRFQRATGLALWTCRFVSFGVQQCYYTLNCKKFNIYHKVYLQVANNE